MLQEMRDEWAGTRRVDRAVLVFRGVIFALLVIGLAYIAWQGWLEGRDPSFGKVVWSVHEIYSPPDLRLAKASLGACVEEYFEGFQAFAEEPKSDTVLIVEKRGLSWRLVYVTNGASGCHTYRASVEGGELPRPTWGSYFPLSDSGEHSPRLGTDGRLRLPWKYGPHLILPVGAFLGGVAVFVLWALSGVAGWIWKRTYPDCVEETVCEG